MAVTGTLTNRDICTSAMRKIGVSGQGETLDAATVEDARAGLERMLKAWQNRGHNLWNTAAQSVALTTAAVYTLDPVRPLAINNMRLKRSGIETPMHRMTREEYDTLPRKDSTGIPTTFYYDRQREAARLYVWPVLAAANGETLEITYTKEQSDIDLNDVADVPGEWWDAVVYGLAARMMDDYEINMPNVMARAEEELRIAQQFDREGSVFFIERY